MGALFARKIIHIDMDAFYASVEIRDRPTLAYKPVAVGGCAKNRGVIATANYKARKFGIRSAMASWKAMQLCPDLIILSPNFDKYREESHAIRDIFRKFTDIIEPLSLDEAYLDVSESSICGGSATLIAQQIRSQIWCERQLTASAGVASNKFLAKVCSEWHKPNGLFVVQPHEIPLFMQELPIEKIPGIGAVTAKKLHALQLFTCRDLQQVRIEILHKYFGSRAWVLHELSFGIDRRVVEVEHIRKSLSVESTFAEDLANLESCLEKMPEFYQKLFHRYEKYQEKYLIKKPFIKIKFADFTTTTVESELYPNCTIESYKALITIGWERKKSLVRLLGLGFSLDLKKESQLLLF